MFIKYWFVYFSVPAGETVITRESVDTSKVWDTANNVYYAFEKSLQGDKQFNMEQLENMESLVQHLMLPKGMGFFNLTVHTYHTRISV